jgi:hypothetical protein
LLHVSAPLALRPAPAPHVPSLIAPHHIGTRPTATVTVTATGA